MEFSDLQAFVVRKSTSLQRKVISLRMDKDSALPVKEFPVKESQFSKHLGSHYLFLSFFFFVDPSGVAVCCILGNNNSSLVAVLELPQVRFGFGAFAVHVLSERRNSFLRWFLSFYTYFLRSHYVKPPRPPQLNRPQSAG